MNKKIILCFCTLLLLLIYPIFVFADPPVLSYPDMETNDQQKYLNEYLGVAEVNPSDVKLVCISKSDGSTKHDVTLKSGSAVLYNSKTDVSITLDGGSADVCSYSGQITVGDGGGTLKGNNGKFIFGDMGSVQVIDGNIYFENLDLKQGSEIEGVSVSGEEISYDSKTGKLSTKNPIKIEGITYSPESEELSYDAKSKRIDTNNQWVSIKKESELIGRLEGVAKIKSVDEILLIASEENPAEFENSKETRIKVSSDTCIGSKCDNKEISRIIYNGDFYVYAKNDNKIEINSKDGDYENFIIPQIKDKSKVELFLNKESGNVLFSFSKAMPLMKGNVNDLKTNIGHIFEDENQERWPWMIYNGRDYNGQVLGEITDFSSIYPPARILKEMNDKGFIVLWIKSFEEFDSETASSALSVLSDWGIDDIEIQKLILEKTPEFDADSAWWALYFTKDLEIQKLIIEKTPEFDTHVVNLIKTRTVSDPKLERMILKKVKKIEDTDMVGLIQQFYFFPHTFENPEIIKLALEKTPEFGSHDGAIAFEYTRDQEMQKLILEKTTFDDNKDIFMVLRETKNDPELQKIVFERTKEFSLSNPDDFFSFLSYVTDPEVKKKVIEKITAEGGLRNALKLSITEDIIEKEKIIRETDFDGSGAALALTATHNPELQKLILKQMGENQFDGYYISFVFESVTEPSIQKEILEKTKEFLLGTPFSEDKQYSLRNFKYLIQQAADNEIIEELLKKVKIVDYYPGWENYNMLKLYSDENFLSQTESLNNVKKWSVAVSTSRLISENWEEEFTSENIKKATKEILQIREEIADKPIIDSQTNVISTIDPETEVYPEERLFSSELLREFIEDCGVEEQKLKFFEGSESSKEPFLNSISKSEGKTTIWFNNHGRIEEQRLIESTTVSYKELGEKLIERGNLDEVTIIFDSCFSYDFKNNLYNYLKGRKDELGDFGTPNIITGTNRLQLGYSRIGVGSPFLASLEQVKPKGEPLTYQDLYDSEEYYFYLQDMSTSISKDGDLINLGFSGDEFKEPSDELDAEPSEGEYEFIRLEDKTVIEISKLEPEMQEKLANA